MKKYICPKEILEDQTLNNIHKDKATPTEKIVQIIILGDYTIITLINYGLSV